MNNDVRLYFERLYQRYNTKEFISTDPICFPHETDGNQEFAAFTAALFAYGNVRAMQKFLAAFFEKCGADPFALKPNPAKLKYRFQSESDVAEYCRIMTRLYQDYGSLERLFVGDAPMKAALAGMEAIRGKYLQKKTRGLSFLFALPGNSASKRVSIFLRWMVRSDEVDFGLWKTFSPAALNIPLDTHIKRISLKMGIISSADNSVKALNKINTFFRKLNPNDPAKYDFALTRLGILFQCLYEQSKFCAKCAEKNNCLFNTTNA